MAAITRHVRPLRTALFNTHVIQVTKNATSTNNCIYQRCFSHHSLQRRLWNQTINSRSTYVRQVKNRPHLCALVIQRFNSSSSNESSDINYIPEPPPLPGQAPPPELADISESLNALGEPSLQSMGLGGWSPAGLMQHALENIHIGLDLPWYGAICLGVCIIRVFILPLYIISQRNNVQVHNHLPVMQRLQDRISQAKMERRIIDVARYSAELQDYTKRNNISYIRSMVVPIAQVPIFLSVFIGLRKMAELPVESLKSGGMLWFTDLTIPDPYYLLPLLTCSTLLATVEVGSDGIQASDMGHRMKWAMRVLPVVLFPLISNFPAAMLCYWMTSNTISLCLVAIFKIPKVRKFFNIEERVKHPTHLSKKKPFVKGFKEAYHSAKIMAEVQDRERVNAARFSEAGKGPIPKTYAYDSRKSKKRAEPKY